MMRVEATDSKVEQLEGTIIIYTTASSLAKKTRGSLTVGSDRTYFNRGSRKDKHSNSTPKSVGRVCTLVRPICHRGEL